MNQIAADVWQPQCEELSLTNINLPAAPPACEFPPALYGALHAVRESVSYLQTQTNCSCLARLELEHALRKLDYVQALLPLFDLADGGLPGEKLLCEEYHDAAAVFGLPPAELTLDKLRKAATLVDGVHETLLTRALETAHDGAGLLRSHFGEDRQSLWGYCRRQSERSPADLSAPIWLAVVQVLANDAHRTAERVEGQGGITGCDLWALLPESGMSHSGSRSDLNALGLPGAWLYLIDCYLDIMRVHGQSFYDQFDSAIHKLMIEDCRALFAGLYRAGESAPKDSSAVLLCAHELAQAYVEVGKSLIEISSRVLTGDASASRAAWFDLQDDRDMLRLNLEKGEPFRCALIMNAEEMDAISKSAKKYDRARLALLGSAAYCLPWGGALFIRGLNELTPSADTLLSSWLRDDVGLPPEQDRKVIEMLKALNEAGNLQEPERSKLSAWDEVTEGCSLLRTELAGMKAVLYGILRRIGGGSGSANLADPLFSPEFRSQLVDAVQGKGASSSSGETEALLPEEAAELHASAARYATARDDVIHATVQNSPWGSSLLAVLLEEVLPAPGKLAGTRLPYEIASIPAGQGTLCDEIDCIEQAFEAGTDRAHFPDLLNDAGFNPFLPILDELEGMEAKLKILHDLSKQGDELPLNYDTLTALLRGTLSPS